MAINLVLFYLAFYYYRAPNMCFRSYFYNLVSPSRDIFQSAPVSCGNLSLPRRQRVPTTGRLNSCSPSTEPQILQILPPAIFRHPLEWLASRVYESSYDEPASFHIATAMELHTRQCCSAACLAATGSNVTSGEDFEDTSHICGLRAGSRPSGPIRARPGVLALWPNRPSAFD